MKALVFGKFFSQSDSPFEREFSREILRAERQRVTILAIVLGASLIINLSLVSIFRTQLSLIYPDIQIGNWIIVVQLCGICYELIARAIFSFFIKVNRQPPILSRYMNALVETSLPSIILLIFARFQGPTDALQNTVVLFYTLFIILSTLRLQFGLCAWTGLIASVEYLGIWLWYSQTHPELLNPSFMLVTLQRGIAFVTLGIVAGLVSMQIRERVSRALKSLEERNRIVNVFGQHVSPLVVEKLLNQKTDATEIRYVCMMFLDIRNFTTFSERSEPVLVIGYLNTLFASMVETINRHHGIINKFLGDGFMAVFGAPLSHGQDCQNAVAAAQEILANVERLVETGTIPPTRIGIGLHAGEAITGNVGSSLRKEYTVIGDVVNVASRIEQLNKHFDSQLLVSDAVWNVLGMENAQAEALEPLTVKGRVESIHIWKLA